MRPRALGLAALLAIGCGGAPPSEVPGDGTATSGGSAVADEPGRTAVGTAAFCPSLAGTRWWFVTDLPSSGHREFEVALHPDGSAFIGDPADTTRGNDGWTQRGCLVVVSMNDRFVDYTGTLEGDRVAGRGLNVRGEKWGFVMTRRVGAPRGE